MSLKNIILAAYASLLSGQLIANPPLIEKKFTAAYPGISIISVEPIEDGSLFQVNFDNGDYVYSIPTGNLFTTMKGELWSISTLTPVNISVKRSIRVVMNIPDEELIIYKSDKERAVITVFTDVDCPYCRKLHKDSKKLNQLGITVKYAGYPRGGLRSPALDKMKSVWCSDDRKAPFMDASKGLRIDSIKPCDDPVMKHFKIGEHIGVKGTPTIVSNTEIIQGYFTAENLANRIISN